ncbi:MAG TPA: ABC transporter ATP-binding protein [Stellaceae bacterium]|nr:ABC transporter ATP-binding protein [Stellaceae bacterium]
MSLLEIRGLTAAYGDFQALYGIDLKVEEGETVAIIGANGAGKTTLLRAITGLLRTPPDCIRFAGAPIGSLAPSRIVRRGIALVPEGRRLFPSLTVEENLRMGAQCGRGGPWTLSRVYGLFPALAARRRAAATALSGGEQQMAAIGRALMANPRLLLCDEISLGLAPRVIRDVYAALPGIRAEGTTVLIVEQDTSRALAEADRIYCLQEGRVTLEGAPAALTRARIRLAYFGL